MTSCDAVVRVVYCIKDAESEDWHGVDLELFCLWLRLDSVRPAHSFAAEDAPAARCDGGNFESTATLVRGGCAERAGVAGIDGPEDFERLRTDDPT